MRNKLFAVPFTLTETVVSKGNLVLHAEDEKAAREKARLAVESGFKKRNKITPTIDIGEITIVG